MSLPFPLVVLSDAARVRQRRLRQRLRLCALVAAGAAFCIIGLAVQAYVSNGFATALALAIAGSSLLIEALRQADRAFIAPLQAHCQADFSRQISAAIAPLLHQSVAQHDPAPQQRAGL